MKSITLTLTVDQVQLIANALGELPYKVAEGTINDIRAQVGRGRVILGLSGGVDSAVAAALVHRAIGDRLTCVYVDHGLMRKRESEILREVFAERLGMKIVMVDAQERFQHALEGVIDPEQKRTIIGREFIRVFDEESVNAFALPGGYVYVTRGLLALAGSEAELASVLAHEIGHVTARHAAQRHQRVASASTQGTSCP